MPLTLDEVDHIAQLARLELGPEQRGRYREQLSQILDYIAKLRELDTTDVPPTAGGGLVQMVLRLDRSQPGLRTEALLATHPRRKTTNSRYPPFLNNARARSGCEGAPVSHPADRAAL